MDSIGITGIVVTVIFTLVIGLVLNFLWSTYLYKKTEYYTGHVFYEYRVDKGPITGVLKISCDDLKSCNDAVDHAFKILDKLFREVNAWVKIGLGLDARNYLIDIDIKYDMKQNKNRLEHQQTYIKNLKENFIYTNQKGK